jgi:hypothetical protein
MKILLSYLFILWMCGVQPEGRYERHNQFCGGLNGEDIKWALDINKNQTYILQITRKNNNYSSKPKLGTIAGTWELRVDTLKLYNLKKTNNPLIFYIKDNRVIFLNNVAVLPNSDLLYLDYLTKSEIEPKKINE